MSWNFFVNKLQNCRTNNHSVCSVPIDFKSRDDLEKFQNTFEQSPISSAATRVEFVSKSNKTVSSTGANILFFYFWVEESSVPQVNTVRIDIDMTRVDRLE